MAEIAPTNTALYKQQIKKCLKASDFHGAIQVANKDLKIL
jgi:hypothetical protein